MIIRRFFASVATARSHRLFCFEKELLRQQNNIGKIEKISVQVSLYNDEQRTLIMNKHISTAYDCALHISEYLAKHSALAVVNGNVVDMHQPLRDETNELSFLTFTDPDLTLVNKAFWRSCSFALGLILESAFKESHNVQLHSWPSVNVRSGSFVYDIGLEMGSSGSWKPSQDELRILSRGVLQKLSNLDSLVSSVNTIGTSTRAVSSPPALNNRFQPLNVPLEIAQEMFKYNKFKLNQLQFIADGGDGRDIVKVYRLADHVDLSQGPMISNSSQFGFFGITAVNPIETSDFGKLYRVQGVSLPFTQRLNSWTWDIVCKFGANESSLPYPFLVKGSSKEQSVAA